MFILLKQTLKPIHFLICVLLISFLGIFYVGFHTDIGLQITLKAFMQLSNGKLQIEDASGTLSSEMKFKKIVYIEPEKKIQIENARFKLSRLALMQWQLKLKTLKADKLFLSLNPDKHFNSPPGKLPYPELPMDLIIEELNLGRVQVNFQGNKIFQLKELKGHLAITEDYLYSTLKSKIASEPSARVFFKLQGTKNNYEFEINFFQKNRSIWTLLGHGDQKQIVFNAQKNKSLNLNGWVKAPEASEPYAQQALNWKISLSANNVPLKNKSFLFNGTLTAQGKDAVGEVEIALFNATYHGQPLDGHVAFNFDYPSIKNLDIALFSGKNTLSAKGNIDPNWDVQWKAKVENLNTWLKTTQGKLNSEGSIFGGRDAPYIQANLTIDQLKIQHITLKKLRAETLFNMNALSDSKILFEAQQIKTNFFEIPSLIFSGNMKKISDGMAVRLNLQPGIFRYPFENKIKVESFAGGVLETQVTSKTVLTKLNLNFLGKSNIQGEIETSNDARQASKKIKGTIIAKMDDLSFLSSFTSPAIRNIQGQAIADIKIKGTLAKPNIKSLTIVKGSAFITIPNLHLEDIQFITRGQNQTIQYEGQARSEDTNIKLNGKTVFQPNTVFSEFNLSSPNFLITNTPEIKIYAAPQLKITSRDGKSFISGTVQIPRAVIKPLDFSSVAVMPEDVEYTGQPNAIQAIYTPPQFPVESDFLITLGDNVYLKYQSLEGYLEGNVRIKSRPLQPTLGIGRIQFREGNFQIKGRKLTVHQGYFNFNGPLMNPGLQIRATRLIQVNNIGGLDPTMDFGVNEILVGIEMTGNLRRQKIRLFSEPSGLSQSNILAYLITGQSITTSSSSYFPLIMEAAGSLGGGTNSDFSEKIKRGLGLSEVAIKQSQTGLTTGKMQDSPTLVLGKLLSPVFYINYTVSLIQPLSGFQARYQLTKHWFIQASTMLGEKNVSSIDIIRTFESKD